MKKADKKLKKGKVSPEEERLTKLNAVRERRQAAKKANGVLEKQEDAEQAEREAALGDIVDVFNVSTRKKIEYLEESAKKEEWAQYLSVDTGPNPRNPPELNCALLRWKNQRTGSGDFALARKRDEEIHPILRVLDEIIRYPDNLTPQQLQIYKEVCEDVSGELMACVEAAIRTWVLECCSELNEVRHAHVSLSYSLALWMLVPLPPHMPKPNDPPSEPIEVNFPELSASVALPGNREWRGAVLEVLWLLDDRLSCACSSFADPEPPRADGADLYEFTRAEYDSVRALREERALALDRFYADVKAKSDALQLLLQEDKFGTMKDERAELDRLTCSEPEPQPAPREELVRREAEENAAYLKSVLRRAESNEVNLRSHRPCGGVLHLKLLQQPPRPKVTKDRLTLTRLEAGERLGELRFVEVYSPPPPPAAGAVRTPEEIEADIRRQEAALERLFLVNVQLPETVLWLEPPIVCCWDADGSRWVTDDVHDLKYNEDKFTVNFRTGQLRPIAFAAYKYSNLPYQGWELKPNKDRSGALVTVMGAIIVAEFEVLETGIKVKSVQNGATKALQDLVEQTFTVGKLIGRMQGGGVDFFPTDDAPNIIEGSSPKLWVMEKHLYQCMAHMCTAYNFTWSRWNVSAGRRAIVQQMREYVDNHGEPLSMLQVSPLRAQLVKATEVSSEYCKDPIDDLKFYPDLYSLMRDRGSAEATALVSAVSLHLVENLKDLLYAVKLFSYS